MCGSERLSISCTSGHCVYCGHWFMMSLIHDVNHLWCHWFMCIEVTSSWCHTFMMSLVCDVAGICVLKSLVHDVTNSWCRWSVMSLVYAYEGHWFMMLSSSFSLCWDRAETIICRNRLKATRVDSGSSSMLVSTLSILVKPAAVRFKWRRRCGYYRTACMFALTVKNMKITVWKSSMSSTKKKKPNLFIKIKQ